MKHYLIVGSGNLAWHLAPNLVEIGVKVTICSRHPELEADHDWRSSIVDFASLPANNSPFDACFLAVPDDAIPTVTKQLSSYLPATTPLVHTSGATAVTAIDDYFKFRAAMWPIRSLRKGEVVPNWSDLPLVYYADSPEFQPQLASLAQALSGLTYRLNDEQRAQLHLAAVFSNNFTTWLCQIAYELCQHKNIPFEALVPIIKNTFSKIDANEPAIRQTGAAIRGDQKTMQRHLDLLDSQPEYAELYQKFSQFIGEYRDR